MDRIGRNFGVDTASCGQKYRLGETATPFASNIKPFTDGYGNKKADSELHVPEKPVFSTCFFAKPFVFDHEDGQVRFSFSLFTLFGQGTAPIA